MNPSLQNFGSHQNPNKGNPMEGFSGFPLLYVYNIFFLNIFIQFKFKCKIIYELFLISFFV